MHEFQIIDGELNDIRIVSVLLLLIVAIVSSELI